VTADAYAVHAFEDFWPHYVRLHTRQETHLLHAVATLSCLALLFAIAQASHRIFETNATTPWKNQLWHTRAELRMLRLVLTGRMAAEVERVQSVAA
jgi:hypothetical protein